MNETYYDVCGDLRNHAYKYHNFDYLYRTEGVSSCVKCIVDVDTILTILVASLPGPQRLRSCCDARRNGRGRWQRDGHQPGRGAQDADVHLEQHILLARLRRTRPLQGPWRGRCGLRCAGKCSCTL